MRFQSKKTQSPANANPEQWDRHTEHSGDYKHDRDLDEPLEANRTRQREMPGMRPEVCLLSHGRTADHQGHRAGIKEYREKKVKFGIGRMREVEIKNHRQLHHTQNHKENHGVVLQMQFFRDERSNMAVFSRD